MKNKTLISAITVLCAVLITGFTAASAKAVAPNLSETEKIIIPQKKEPYCKLTDEEYDMMQYIEIIKGFDRKPTVRNSNAVRGSNAVSWSNAVRGSNAVSGSDAVSGSNAVRGSNAVSGCFAIRECEAVKNAIFCYKIEGRKNVIFNKKCTAERFRKVYSKLKSFNWNPRFENWYDIKGNKEWWAFCFPELREVSNKDAWSKMPSEMREYIENLPEYNKKIFKKITE